MTVEAESLIRKPVKELPDELTRPVLADPPRHLIVNVDHIASVRRPERQAEIALRDHRETLIVSRAFIHLFKQM